MLFFKRIQAFIRQPSYFLASLPFIVLPVVGAIGLLLFSSFMLSLALPLFATILIIAASFIIPVICVALFANFWIGRNVVGLIKKELENSTGKINYKYLKLLLTILKQPELSLEINGIARPLLHFFCEKEDINQECISVLLGQGAAPNVKDNYNEKTALHYACENKNSMLEIIELLLKKMDKKDLNIKSKVGDTALHYACENKKPNINIIKLLLEKGADLTISDEFGDQKGNPPWYYVKSNQEIMGFLIKKYKEEKNQDKQTMLHIACIEGDNKLIKELVEKGADCTVKTKNGNTPLHLACANEKIDYASIQLLINNTSNIDITGSNGFTSLHAACQNENSEKSVMQLLILKGGNVNIKDKNNNLCLQVACMNKNINKEAIEYLLKETTDINSKNKLGKTALHYICSNPSGNADILKLFFSENKSCDPNIKDNQGTTALMLAVKNENSQEIIKILLENGADPNIKDNKGNTALHRICQNIVFSGDSSPYIKSIKLLIENGADQNSKDDHGRSFLDYVKENKKLNDHSEFFVNAIPTINFYQKVRGLEETGKKEQKTSLCRLL